MTEFEKLVQKTEENVIKNLVKKGFDIGQTGSLQRTDEWFKQRKGRFTGSGIKDLMGCSRSTSKMEWGRAEKLVDFNETAKKYVYEKAKEKQRGKVVRIPVSAAMRYGTENEQPVINLMLQKFPHYNFKEVGFIEFIKGIAGASPDGLLEDKITKELIGYEGKCTTNWGTLYSRCEISVDQKHQDFWQLQAEMLALNVKKILYVIGEPSENIFEPNITDISTVMVDASPIHQQAIMQRCKIGSNAIELYLKGINIHEALLQSCTNFEI